MSPKNFAVIFIDRYEIVLDEFKANNRESFDVNGFVDYEFSEILTNFVEVQNNI